MPDILPTLPLDGLDIVASAAPSEAGSELLRNEATASREPGEDAGDFAEVLALVISPLEQPRITLIPETIEGQAGNVVDAKQRAEAEVDGAAPPPLAGRGDAGVAPTPDTSHTSFAPVRSAEYSPGPATIEGDAARPHAQTSGGGMLAADSTAHQERPLADQPDRAAANQQPFATEAARPRSEGSVAERKSVSSDSTDARGKVAGLVPAHDTVQLDAAPQPSPLTREISSPPSDRQTSSEWQQPQDQQQTPARVTNHAAGGESPPRTTRGETADTRGASSWPGPRVPLAEGTPALVREVDAVVGERDVPTAQRLPPVTPEVVRSQTEPPTSLRRPVAPASPQGPGKLAERSDRTLQAVRSEPAQVPWQPGDNARTPWQAPDRELKSAPVPTAAAPATPSADGTPLTPQTAAPSVQVVRQDQPAAPSDGDFAVEGKLPEGDVREAAPSAVHSGTESAAARLASVAPSSESGLSEDRLPRRDVEAIPQSAGSQPVTTDQVPLTEPVETSTSRPPAAAPAPDPLPSNNFEVFATDDLPLTARVGRLEEPAGYDLTLDSPELGKLWLFVRGTRGEIEARIETATDKAFRMIRDEMGPLHRVLQDAGFQGADLSLGRRDPDQHEGWPPPPPPPTRPTTPAGPAGSDAAVGPGRFVSTPAWQGNVNLLA